MFGWNQERTGESLKPAKIMSEFYLTLERKNYFLCIMFFKKKREDIFHSTSQEDSMYLIAITAMFVINLET